MKNLKKGALYVPLLLVLYTYSAYPFISDRSISEQIQQHLPSHIDLNNLSFFFSSVRILNTSIKANITRADDKKCQINISKIKLNTLKLKISDKWIPVKNISATGTLEFYRNNKTNLRLTVSLPDAGQIHIELERLPNQTNFTITAPDINILPLIKKFLLNNIPVKGTIPVSLNVEGTINEITKQTKLDIKVRVNHASWEDEAFEYAGDGVKAVLMFSGEISELNPFNLSGKGILEIPEGNVLIKSTAVDFKNNPISLRLTLDANPQKGKIEFNPLKIYSGRDLQLIINGNLLKTINVQLHIESLEKFENLILADSREKYNLSGWMDISGLVENVTSHNKSIKGTIKANISLSSKESLGFTALANLPFLFSSKSNKSLQKKQSARGYVKIPFINLGNLSAKDIVIKVSLCENGWELTDRVKIPFMKGTIAIQEGFLKILPDISGYISISTPECPEYILEAEYLSYLVPLRICFPKLKIILQKRDIHCNGDIKINLFSGELLVNHLKVENIFSPSRSITMDAQWKDIDLKQLSSVTSFGLITGRLKGYVKNLRIAYGAPVAFDLVIESQPGKNQIISVAAIENITQIGSATSPFQTIVGKAMTTFFKSFSYDRIGIRCTLKNDFFSLEGLIKEGKTEYLIRRRGIKGVNVINKQSPNLISWREMINRLKRIKRVESTEGGEKTNAEEK